MVSIVAAWNSTTCISHGVDTTNKSEVVSYICFHNSDYLWRYNDSTRLEILIVPSALTYL